MKKQFLKRAFCVGAVVLLLAVLCIPAFADSSELPDTPHGTYPSNLISVINSPAAAAERQRWVYIDQYSTIDFAVAWDILSRLGASVSWTYDSTGDLWVYDIVVPIVTGFAIDGAVLVQDTSTIYNSFGFHRHGNVTNSDLTFRIMAGLSSKSTSATVGWGDWFFYADSGMVYNGSLAVGSAGSSSVVVPSSSFVLGYHYNGSSDTYSMYYSNGSYDSLYSEYRCDSFFIGSTDGMTDVGYPPSVNYYLYNACFSLLSPMIYGNYGENVYVHTDEPVPSPDDDSIAVFSYLRSFIFSFFEAPSFLLSSILNFDIFGINLYKTACLILTIVLLSLVVSIVVKIILRLR